MAEATAVQNEASTQPKRVLSRRTILLGVTLTIMAAVLVYIIVPAAAYLPYSDYYEIAECRACTVRSLFWAAPREPVCLIVAACDSQERPLSCGNDRLAAPAVTPGNCVFRREICLIGDNITLAKCWRSRVFDGTHPNSEFFMTVPPALPPMNRDDAVALIVVMSALLCGACVLLSLYVTDDSDT